MYYLRVACACAWMWVEERTPLFSLSAPPVVDWQGLEAAIERRLSGASSAFEVAETWFEAVDEVARNRKSLNDMISLPMRMSEIRDLVTSVGLGDNRRVVKTVRAALDRRYRQRLFEEVGEIPARPEQPLTTILQHVADASRALRPEMRLLASTLVTEHVAPAEG
jgi:hypothetical protein